jgi:hypothetical protein
MQFILSQEEYNGIAEKIMKEEQEKRQQLRNIVIILEGVIKEEILERMDSDFPCNRRNGLYSSCTECPISRFVNKHSREIPFGLKDLICKDMMGDRK